MHVNEEDVMKKKIMIVLFFIFLSKIIKPTETLSLISSTNIDNDSQAINYCKTHKNTYVVIIWPRGIEFLKYIVAHLHELSTVKYVKTMVFKRKSIFLLYCALHKEMSYKTAKKYFKPYLLDYQKKAEKLAALIIETDAPLESLLKWKREMRNHIGQKYYSLHINDYYWPETIEAAQAVFCDFKSVDLTR